MIKGTYFESGILWVAAQFDNIYIAKVGMVHDYVMDWTWFFFSSFFLHKRTCLNATLKLFGYIYKNYVFLEPSLLQYDIRFLFIKWNLSTDFFSFIQSAFLKRVRMTECKIFTIDPIDLSIERWFNGKRFCRHNKYVRVLILVWATISSQLKSSKHLTISSNVSFFYCQRLWFILFVWDVNGLYFSKDIYIPYYWAEFPPLQTLIQLTTVSGKCSNVMILLEKPSEKHYTVFII